MKQNLVRAVLMTIVTTVILGLIYPMAITALSKMLFPRQASGQLIYRDNELVGSRIIGQAFKSTKYFHSRPSAAGDGYDAGNSGGSNLGPTNQKLLDRVRTDAARVRVEDNASEIPSDLITTSGSGLDPHISPASAQLQIARVARERHLPQEAVQNLVAKHTEGRQLGFLGEPRVNVLELNLDLDREGQPMRGAK